jgi:sulfate permease, SulP family
VLLGVKAEGHNFIELVLGLLAARAQVHPATAVMGALTVAFLFWARSGLKPLLQRLGLSPRAADVVAKAGPVAASPSPPAHLGAPAGRRRA